METGNNYTRHIYEVLRVLRYYTVYQLKDVQNGAKQLTDVIRIEDYRGYSRGSGFNDLLRLRTSSNWKTSELVTGLKVTKTNNTYFGDRIHNGKKNLLIFRFTPDRQRLIIDYFPAFYPVSKRNIPKIIKTHYTA